MIIKMTMNKVRLIAMAFFAVSLAVSCKSQYEMLLNSNDAEAKYKMALQYFEEEKYPKAASLFESLSVMTSGTERDDTVQFYWGLSNYRSKDYYTAETNFSKFIENFPRSPFAAQASFLRLDCLYRSTYRYELDQTPTRVAIAAINEFMIDSPDSPDIEKCNEMLEDLNGRLDQKAYEAARLYYKMEDYIASRVALRNVLKENSDNIYREDILYYIAMSSYKYAYLSVHSKQKDRYLTFIDDYLNFIGELPDSKYRRELDILYKRAQKALGRPVDISLIDDVDEKYFVKERKKLDKETRRMEKQKKEETGVKKERKPFFRLDSKLNETR